MPNYWEMLLLYIRAFYTSKSIAENCYNHSSIVIFCVLLYICVLSWPNTYSNCRGITFKLRHICYFFASKPFYETTRCHLMPVLVRKVPVPLFSCCKSRLSITRCFSGEPVHCRIQAINQYRLAWSVDKAQTVARSGFTAKPSRIWKLFGAYHAPFIKQLLTNHISI